MAQQPIETGTVTAELALRQDSWPKELRGVCETLRRSPAEALTAMTVSIRLTSAAEEPALRDLSAGLAEQYHLRQAVSCTGRICTIRLSRRAGDGASTGAVDEPPAPHPDRGLRDYLARAREAARHLFGARFHQ
jgi:hypothetical protein